MRPRPCPPTFIEQVVCLAGSLEPFRSFRLSFGTLLHKSAREGRDSRATSPATLLGVCAGAPCLPSFRNIASTPIRAAPEQYPLVRMAVLGQSTEGRFYLGFAGSREHPELPVRIHAPLITRPAVERWSSPYHVATRMFDECMNLKVGMWLFLARLRVTSHAKGRSWQGLGPRADPTPGGTPPRRVPHPHPLFPGEGEGGLGRGTRTRRSSQCKTAAAIHDCYGS